MRVINWALWATALSLMAMIVGCGGGSIFVAASYPPQVPMPAGVKTIAVTPFMGTDDQSRPGAQMAAAVLASELKRGLPSQYTIVERSNLADIMKELDMADAGITDTTTAAKAGKLLNADAIIIGTVQVQQSETVETTSDTSYNAKGLPMTTTKQKLRRTGQVMMTTKMVYPETAEVIVSKSSSHDYDSNLRGGFAAFLNDNSDVPAPEFITRSLLEECVRDFYKTIAPHVELLEFKLAGGKTELAKTGTSMAKAGDYKEAAELFQESLKLEPEDHGTMYNLAIMKMLQGDLAGAKENVDKAMRMKSDKKYIELCQYLRSAQESGVQVSFRPASGEEVVNHKSRMKMLNARM